MTRQNKQEQYYSPKPQAHKLANSIRTILQKSIVLGLFSTGFISVAQAQTTDPLQASDIDWVNLEDLDDATRAEIQGNCCGLYIEPELPPLEGDPDSTHLSADNNIAVSNDPANNTITLEGNIEVRQQDQQIQADYGLYNRNTETLELTGNIKIRQPGMLLIGTDAVVDRANQTSQLSNASYVMHTEGVRGTAEIIVYTDAQGIVTIDNGLYTRCEPGNSSWTISSSKITLNQEKGRGVARNAVLKIKGVPVFYSPYMNFPINDQRASGFLMPSFGSTRDGGFDFSIPYYFNLAPNYDATLTPRLITDRGLMMNLEGRYRGQRSSNVLTLGYLSNDKLYDEDTANLLDTDSPPVDDRWLVDYDYRGRFGNNWNALIDYSEVSDDDYFQDLGNMGLDSISFSYLSRNARLNYLGNHWDFSVSTQSYQVIDPNVSLVNLPYDSLPRFNLDGYFDTSFGLQYGLETEYVYFDRSLDRSSLSLAQVNNGALVSGQRLSVEPVISWPWSSPGAFVTPTLKYKYARYELEDQALNTSEQQSRGIFMASLDSGLIFEREIDFFGGNYTQTLEPRIFYLYSEFEDQSEIPIFDSADMTFSFSQLFREDRFSGKDRVGDSDQVTIALSTKFFNRAGQQKASASIGQIFYFEDRRVTLRNRLTPTLRDSKSATAAELSYRFSDNWRASTYVEWNTNTHSMDAGSFQFRYQSDLDHILNVSYRYRDETPRLNTFGIDRRIVQTDISGIWPLSQNWGLIARWNYDHANERLLEGIAGIEYDSCCWNVRLVAREWIDQDDLYLADVENDTGIFLQFELKGLGSILGSNVSSILSNGINGYRAHEYGQ